MKGGRAGKTERYPAGARYMLAKVLNLERLGMKEEDGLRRCAGR